MEEEGDPSGVYGPLVRPVGLAALLTHGQGHSLGPQHLVQVQGHIFQFAPYFRGLPPNRGFLAEKQQFAPYLPPIFLKNPLFFFNWVDLTTNFLIFCPSGTNLSQGDQARPCKSVELNTEY